MTDDLAFPTSLPEFQRLIAAARAEGREEGLKEAARIADDVSASYGRLMDGERLASKRRWLEENVRGSECVGARIRALKGGAP